MPGRGDKLRDTGTSEAKAAPKRLQAGPLYIRRPPLAAFADCQSIKLV